MLVSAKEMLNKAKAGKYAVGQFNINNLEWTKAILLTAEELKSPVILGVSEGAGKYMCGYTTVVGMVKGRSPLHGHCYTAVKSGRRRNVEKVGQCMTQIQEILTHIKKHGSITTLEAFRLGITRLASRVFEMKERGIDIRREMVTVLNRNGEKCRVARYFIPGGIPECFGV